MWNYVCMLHVIYVLPLIVNIYIIVKTILYTFDLLYFLTCIMLTSKLNEKCYKYSVIIQLCLGT